MVDNVLQVIIKAGASDAVAQIKATADQIKALGAQGKSTSTSMQSLIDGMTRVTASQTSAKESASAFQSSLVQEREAFNRLLASLDPVFAAEQRYKSVISEVAIQRRLGTITLDEESRALRANEQIYQSAGGRMRTLSQGFSEVGGASSNMRFQVQNASYQIGDFAVQVAGGTSAVRAMSQQLPQLLGGFGLWGAVFGAAAAILVPLIGSLFKTGQTAEEAKKSLDTLTAALSSYIAYAKTAGSSAEELQTRFGRFADQMRKDAQWMAQVELGKANAEFKTAAAAIASGLDSVATAQKNAVEAARNYQAAQDLANKGMGTANMAQSALDAFTILSDQVDEAAKAMGLTAEQAIRVRDALNEMGRAQGPQELERTSQAAIDLLGSMFTTGQTVPPVIAEIAVKLSDVHDKAVEATLTMEKMPAAMSGLQSLIESARDAMASLVNAQPGSGWLSVAFGRVDTLGAKLWNAAAAAAALAASSPGRIDTMAWPQAERHRQDVEDMAGRWGVEVQPGNMTPGGVKPKSSPAGIDGFDTAGSGKGGSSGGGSAALSGLAALSKAAADALATLNQAIAAINEKVKAGLMSTADAAKAVTSAKSTAGNAIADLIPKMEEFGAKGTDAAGKLRAELKGLGGDLHGISKQLSESFSSGFESAFADFLKGTKNAGQAFQAFGQSVLDTMAKIIAQRFTSSVVTPFLDSILGSIGLFSAKGNVIPYAKGGLPGIRTHANTIVTNPTLFAMGGGQTGLMGEAGPEAIMPMKRGGVRAIGPGGEYVLPLARVADGSLAVATPFALGGVSSGAYVGSSSSGQRMAAPGNVIVNITAPEGTTAKQTGHRTQGNDTILDLLLEQVKGSIVGDMRTGSGSFPAAMQQFYGVKRVVS